MKRLTLRAILTLLVAAALASVYAAASLLWEPGGTIGLSTDYGAVVRSVVPGSPAAQAGIVAGDRVDLAAIPLPERRFVAGVAATPPAGKTLTLRIVHDHLPRTVLVTAVPAEPTRAYRLSLLLQCAAALVFITVGATLISLRPSAATWGFGLYCLLVLPTANYPFRLPLGTDLAAIGLYDVLQNLGVVGLVVFALEFPRPIDVGWRRRIRRSLPVIFVLLALMTLYPDVANLLLGRGAGLENHLLQLAFGAVFGLSLIVLLDSYRRVSRAGRERLRWVLAGFGFGLIASYLGNTLLFSSLIPIEPPAWLINLLVSINVLLPLAVAHAVVRHRVLDINFVIGRALVYAILTTALAAIFSVLDWFFGSVLEEFRLSRFIQAAISIGIAFGFDSVHKRLELAIEAIFFRKRRIAEERLTRLTRELPQARQATIVKQALVEEAADALELVSAALFLPTADGALTRADARGWNEGCVSSLDDGDLLVLALRAGKRSIKLTDLPWRRTDVPAGNYAPLVAIPMHSRADLTGIAVYGGHLDGADVDPAEIALLEGLAHAASIALDELDAERLQIENAAQLATIAALDARLDELRALLRQPAEPATLRHGE